MPPKQPNLGICSRILRPMQKTKNICWFLAIIVIMFYSQRSRRVIMEASKTWDIRGKTTMERIVFSLFKNLLYDRYLIVGDDPHNSKEYRTFNEATFVEILKRLFEMNSNDFPYNPDDNKRYHMDSYIYKLYNLLGVDCKMFDYEPAPKYKGELYYSSINKEFDHNISISSIDNTVPYIPGLPPYILNPNVGVYKDDGHAPSILIITRTPFLTPFANNKIVDDNITRELSSMKQKITYNGFEYNLDSVYLINANSDHAIVGMTCKNKKYIFNGEPYMGRRNFPCVLIPHNWNILQDRDFYLWDNDCELHDKAQKTNINRYNFSEGKRRFIYVRKNASRDTSHSKESDVAKYRQEQRDVDISDKQRETVRLEEARLRFQSDVEKVHQEIKEDASIQEKRRETVRLEEQIKEEAIPKKPNPSQLARLLTPLSLFIPSLFPNKIEKEKERKRLSDERRETARLRQKEERREAIRLRQKEERREAIRLRKDEERREAIRLRQEEERKRLSDERREAVRLRQERKRLSDERKEAVRLRQEKERKRLSDERRETARLRQDEQKKEEEKRHYEEQMVLIKEEEQKQRNILHKSAPQIDELVNIMSNFTLDDKKINKKRIRKSNSSPKVIKRRPLKRIRKSNSSGSARRPLKRYKGRVSPRVSL